MRKGKMLVISLIVYTLFASGCSPAGSIQKINYYGNSYVYNGKTYTVYSILSINKPGKQVGIKDTRIKIYEIDSLDSNSWLALQYPESAGTDQFAVLKENNAPEFSLDSFPVNEIQIVAIPGTTISGIIIKDKKMIDLLINKFKNDEPVIIPTNIQPTIYMYLFSSKFPNLIYELDYYSYNGKNYIKNSNITGEAIEIGDLLSDLLSKYIKFNF